MMARFPYPARPGRRLIRIVIFAIVIAALSIPVAAATASAATTCDRVFTGNSTGSRDVTSSLTSFFRYHSGGVSASGRTGSIG